MGRHSFRSPRRERPISRRFLICFFSLVVLLAGMWFGMPETDRAERIIVGMPEGIANDASEMSAPCAPTARACVDLGSRRAWLRDSAGRVVFGPVPITAGSPDLATPTGDFSVLRKNIDHVSSLYEGAPMPFAVFFDDRGFAFHEGDLTTQSAGCIRLGRTAAERFYGELQIGDTVQIVP